VDKKEELQSLESEKAQMIARYMALQDQADSLNDEIYKTCCGVEALNVKIEALQAELKKSRKKTAAKGGPTNGTSHPPGQQAKTTK